MSFETRRALHGFLRSCGREVLTPQSIAGVRADLRASLIVSSLDYNTPISSPQSGIMEEMMQDTLEMDEDDEMEEEADAEVEKVLYELTDGKLGQVGSVKTDLPVSGRSSHTLMMAREWSSSVVNSILIGYNSSDLYRLLKRKKRILRQKQRWLECRKSCKIF